MAKQELYTDKVLGDMTKQTEQVMAFASLYQKQAEKVTAFWLDRSMDAVKETQSFAKEWMTLGNKIAADLTQTATASMKDAARLFTPPA